MFFWLLVTFHENKPVLATLRYMPFEHVSIFDQFKRCLTTRGTGGRSTKFTRRQRALYLSGRTVIEMHRALQQRYPWRTGGHLNQFHSPKICLVQPSLGCQFIRQGLRSPVSHIDDC